MATRAAVARLIKLFYPAGQGPCLGGGEEEERVQSRVSLYDLVLIRAQDNHRESRNRDPAVQSILDMAGSSLDYGEALVPRKTVLLDDHAGRSTQPLPTPKSSERRRPQDSTAERPHFFDARSPAASQHGLSAKHRHPPAAGARKASRLKGRKKVSRTTPSTGPPPFKRQKREGDLDAPPRHEYQTADGGSSPSMGDVDFKTLGERRGQRRKALYKNNKNHADAEVYASKDLEVEDLPMSQTGWMGTMYDGAAAQALRQAHKAGDVFQKYLQSVVMVPYKGIATRITDSHGRLIIFRSQVSEGVIKLMPEFMKQVAEFVRECAPMPEAAMEANRRGDHWFCIAGVDRNLKERPNYSEWHRTPRNSAAIDKAFQPGTPFSNISGQASDLCAAVFPNIAKRYRFCADAIKQKYGLKPMFGLFWNWCLNATLPTKGVKRVQCEPHVDWKNIALGVCVVFVYGIFNHREKAWLVIWEANVCVELPPGVFLLYSSSLFFHFNVDISAIKIVTTKDGEKPTPDNSTPLRQHNPQRPDNIQQEDWDLGNGRGSVVWFNQASMFQTSETGHDTLTMAREAGHTGNCDVNSFLYGDQAVFPQT